MHELHVTVFDTNLCITIACLVKNGNILSMWATKKSSILLWNDVINFLYIFPYKLLILLISDRFADINTCWTSRKTTGINNLSEISCSLWGDQKISLTPPGRICTGLTPRTWFCCIPCLIIHNSYFTQLISRCPRKIVSVF